MAFSAGLAGIAVIAALAAPVSASAATTGTVSGATIDSAGTRVSVSNMQLVFDSCGGVDPFAGITGCGPLAGLVPASQACPSGGSGMQTIWDPGPNNYVTAGTRTFNSGPVSAAVPSPVAYRVCLYSYLVSQNYGRTTPALRAEAITPSPSPPAPAPPGGLTKPQATQAAVSALVGKYGRRYKRGKRKQMKCSETATGSFKCAVGWKYKRRRYEGVVIVSGSPSNPDTLIRVKGKQVTRL